MNVDCMKEKLKNNSKYWLDYDYYIYSTDSELYTIRDSICILNQLDSFCMVTDYNREFLNDLEKYLTQKSVGSKEILINFQYYGAVEVEKEKSFLESKQYRFNTRYDTYVICKNCKINTDYINNSNIVELAPSNIKFYKYVDCEVEIKYRPSFEKLINVFVLNGNGRIIAYIENGNILGYLSYFNIFDDVNDVDYIYVSEENRQRGIGTLLGKCYAAQSIMENKHALWSNANEISAKTALTAGFKWCCGNMSFYKKINN